mmetsp:Transcript_10059/g.29819  ORF Transcript_10059/g.29819 Transcript_10059/m.29819 type:complete len:793 (-) Transcript_10059:95-2473(-)
MRARKHERRGLIRPGLAAALVLLLGLVDAAAAAGTCSAAEPCVTISRSDLAAAAQLAAPRWKPAEVESVFELLLATKDAEVTEPRRAAAAAEGGLGDDDDMSALGELLALLNPANTLYGLAATLLLAAFAFVVYTYRSRRYSIVLLGFSVVYIYLFWRMGADLVEKRGSELVGGLLLLVPSLAAPLVVDSVLLTLGLSNQRDVKAFAKRFFSVNEARRRRSRADGGGAAGADAAADHGVDRCFSVNIYCLLVEASSAAMAAWTYEQFAFPGLLAIVAVALFLMVQNVCLLLFGLPHFTIRDGLTPEQIRALPLRTDFQWAGPFVGAAAYCGAMAALALGYTDTFAGVPLPGIVCDDFRFVALCSACTSFFLFESPLLTAIAFILEGRGRLDWKPRNLLGKGLLLEVVDTGGLLSKGSEVGTLVCLAAYGGSLYLLHLGAMHSSWVVVLYCLINILLLTTALGVATKDPLLTRVFVSFVVHAVTGFYVIFTSYNLAQGFDADILRMLKWIGHPRVLGGVMSWLLRLLIILVGLSTATWHAFSSSSFDALVELFGRSRPVATFVYVPYIYMLYVGMSFLVRQESESWVFAGLYGMSAAAFAQRLLEAVLGDKVVSFSSGSEAGPSMSPVGVLMYLVFSLRVWFIGSSSIFTTVAAGLFLVNAMYGPVNDRDVGSVFVRSVLFLAVGVLGNSQVLMCCGLFGVYASIIILVSRELGDSSSAVAFIVLLPLFAFTTMLGANFVDSLGLHEASGSASAMQRLAFDLFAASNPASGWTPPEMQLVRLVWNAVSGMTSL